MIQRNRFEMATHEYEMRWPTSQDRTHYQGLMELRESGDKLIQELKTLSTNLHAISKLNKTFEQIWK